MKSTLSYRQRAYRLRRARGVCTNCCTAAGGRAYCPRCAAKNDAAKKHRKHPQFSGKKTDATPLLPGMI
jgi:hypothetical protein